VNVGRLQEKHSDKFRRWIQDQHLLYDGGNPRKIVIHLAGSRTFFTHLGFQTVVKLLSKTGGYARVQFVLVMRKPKFTGLFPNGVTGTFHSHNHSSHILNLEPIQSLTWMTSSNKPCGVKKRPVPRAGNPNTTTADSLEIWKPQPPEKHLACAGLNRNCFTLL
jgi:hypothetical protein